MADKWTCFACLAKEARVHQSREHMSDLNMAGAKYSVRREVTDG